MITIGLPRMHKEPEEVRDFLPSFVEALTPYGTVLIEGGYGGSMEIPIDDYLKKGARIATPQEIFGADYTIVIRAPSNEKSALMKRGATLISMLHKNTHPQRMGLLNKAGVHSIPLDGLVDGNKNRLVGALDLTAWNGMDIALDIFFSVYYRLGHTSPERQINVTILGTGRVALHAAQAAVYGASAARYEDVRRGHLPPIVPRLLSRGITRSEEYLIRMLEDADILVDATARSDATQYIIPNRLLSYMPTSSIILDLTADPYDAATIPPVVKAIEGIPTGDLKQYVFLPDDPSYNHLPPFVDHTHRRTVVSCYSWPGITPSKCMARYEEQLLPLLKILFTSGTVNLREGDNPLETALYNARTLGGSEL